jgi:predicted RNase H-like HicB family nuclease
LELLDQQLQWYCASMSEGGSVRLTAAISQEEQLYVARCLEVEVTSQGESVEEALRNLQEALELYFEDMPLPRNLKPPLVAPVEVHVPLSA